MMNRREFLTLAAGAAAFTGLAGAGKKVIAYIPEKQEPELMYKMFYAVEDTMESLLIALDKR